MIDHSRKSGTIYLLCENSAEIIKFQITPLFTIAVSGFLTVNKGVFAF